MQPRVGAIQGQFFNLSFDLGTFYSCGYTYICSAHGFPRGNWLGMGSAWVSG